MSVSLGQYVKQPPNNRCTQSGCNNSASDAYKIDGNPACYNCYFDQLGNLVEKPPIGSVVDND
ncbi:MAG: hypothetical protein WBP40_02620 [Candidatus Moraniibacteriota bacterium]